jgi:anti-anti-sigma factor
MGPLQFPGVERVKPVSAPLRSQAVDALILVRAGGSFSSVVTGMAAAPFEGSFEIRDGRAVVTLCGEVDVTTTGQLEDVLREAIAAATAAVHVGAGQLTYVDSGGIRVFVNACERARERGLTFVLEQPRHALRRSLEVLGLDAFLLRPHDG